MSSRRFLVLLAAAGPALGGCLADSYRIPDAEVNRLAQLSPEARSASVRVLQRTVFSSDVPDVVPEPVYADSSSAHLNVNISGGGGAGGGGRPVMPRQPVAPRPRMGSGGGSSSFGKLDVGGDKSAAVLLVAAAAAVTVGLVATEGMRYDGWARMRPDQPVHLMYPGGGSDTRRLADLSAEDAAASSEIVVSESGMQRLGRAPLDRKGFAWRFELGSADALTPDGERLSATGAHMGLGYFPTQTLGFMVFTQLAGGGEEATGEYMNARLGLEANWMPLHLARLHAGGYASAALAYGSADGGGLRPAAYSTTAYGTGALAEIDLTTRLALVVRLGATVEPRRDFVSQAAYAGTVGFSVY